MFYCPVCFVLPKLFNRLKNFWILPGLTTRIKIQLIFRFWSLNVILQIFRSFNVPDPLHTSIIRDENLNWNVIYQNNYLFPNVMSRTLYCSYVPSTQLFPGNTGQVFLSFLKRELGAFIQNGQERRTVVTLNGQELLGIFFSFKGVSI